MTRIKVISGKLILVPDFDALQIRKLRQIYGIELLVAETLDGGVVCTIYGRELLRVKKGVGYK